MPYAALGLRCLIGLVFLVSSLSKVAGRGRFRAFAAAVEAMGLPRHRVVPVAGIVVLAEFAVWLLLVLSPAAGFPLAAALLGVFAAGILVVLRRGTPVPCRCFGASAPLLGRRHVVRNAVLAVGAVAGAVAVSLSGGGWGGAGGLTDGAVVAVAAVSGLCVAGVVVILDDLLELFRPLRPTQPARSAQPARSGVPRGHSAPHRSSAK
ncbi:hypothetical protein GCM10009801_16810 [Streptomyces albiaxialis]|uniref:Methylamine utilisation protein MauE domain-containing protein n=1 Tax=Streptomyces albiaxialis TaxID=329523 RepID=A0ABN2VPG1_9ACTN